jgi:hypothetical protein
MMSVVLTGLRRSASGNHLSATGERQSPQRAAAQGFHGNGLSDDGLRDQTEGCQSRE